MSKIFNINVAVILVGLICIPVGLFCASDMYWQTFGHGTPGGYVLAFVGAIMAGVGIYEVNNDIHSSIY